MRLLLILEFSVVLTASEAEALLVVHSGVLLAVHLVRYKPRHRQMVVVVAIMVSDLVMVVVAAVVVGDVPTLVGGSDLVTPVTTTGIR